MRLIDADALLKYSSRVVEYDEAGFSMEYNAVPTEEIKNAPTVEVKPLIHCKDCEHWGTGVAGETEHVKCCEYGKYMVGENGFCCYADMRKKVE